MSGHSIPLSCDYVAGRFPCCSLGKSRIIELHHDAIDGEIVAAMRHLEAQVSRLLDEKVGGIVADGRGRMAAGSYGPRPHIIEILYLVAVLIDKFAQWPLPISFSGSNHRRCFAA